MFSKTVILCWAMACVFAAPPTDVVPLEKQQPTVIPIVSQSEELEPNGTYKFSYETGNGIKREETSYDKVIPKAQGRSADSNEGGESGESDEIHVQQGSYSYTAPDGTLISVRYIADENGFQPIGDHIPRVPSPTQGDGSSGRSSKALNVPDSASAGSSPAIAARSALKPEPKPDATSVAEEAVLTEAKPEEAKPKETKSEVTEGASDAASTTAADSDSTKAEKDVQVSKATEAASTIAPNSSEISSEQPTESASTTEAAKADASTVGAEATTANAEASTTETASTTAAA